MQATCVGLREGSIDNACARPNETRPNETFSGGPSQAELMKLPVRGRIYASFSDIEYRIRSYGKMVEVTSTVVPLAAR